MCRSSSAARAASGRFAGLVAGALSLWPSAALAQSRILHTKHNLSVSGPGTVRAVSENEVCIFCHTPHNSTGVKPLWNRSAPLTSYQIYRSSTLDAALRQPTGASKLCLSCHDGTIALGNVASRQTRIQMATGDFLPPGNDNLGTDLSDDHPISFAFTSALAAADRQLVSPGALHPELRLDAAGELQCTTCHDAHDNTHGDFLVADNRHGALCLACHQMDGWDRSAHRTSSATLANPALGDWPFATVGENACRSCHRPHSAGGAERLLIFEAEEDNCLSCHDGGVARSDIRGELGKRSAHDPRRYTWRHDPTESLGSARPHVECSDCHDPHAVMSVRSGSSRDRIGPTLASVAGISAEGGRVEEARHEHEVCFKCHGDSAVPIPRKIERVANSDNLRLDFSVANESFHPLVSPSSSRDTVSLASDRRSGAVMRCTDCHDNDSGPDAGGGGPSGPHGSIYPFLLQRNYTTTDNTRESASAYAMCYKCHRRSSILGDESFRGHKRHIVGANAPCSACHDPHGVSRTSGSFRSDHTHLINFDTSIVSPERSTGRLEFNDRGRFSGTCTLTCHGVPHLDSKYP